MARPGETTVDFGERRADAGERRSEALTWVFPASIAGSVALLAHGSTLGRADSCSIQVDCEGVSRRHVALIEEGAALIARDCYSTNGTFLNGRRVTRARLHAGAVLRLGSGVGVVRALAGSRGLPAGFGPIASDLWGGDELRQAIEPARRAAPGRLPISIVGETGTGKDVCARAIHEWSARTGPFLAMSCAALPKERAEAELFGYLRRAQGGTLLLDEVDELPLPLQAQLLRVLQEQVLTPLGQAEPVPIDVRVLCASRVALARAVTAGTFRGDLFRRVQGVQVELPALRARRADIPWLFQRCLAAGGAAPAVHARLVEALCLYSWPGNVRGLERVCQRLLASHADAPRLLLEHLPCELRPEVTETAREIATGEADRGREDLERLASKLRHNGARLSRACDELGISRQRAYRLLEGRSVRELLAELGH